jgi:isopropylmalate/homocitrate/citramalate synthase
MKLEMLNQYSRMAIEKGKIPIQPHKAIVGENAFLRPMYIWAGIDMAKESWMLHESLSSHLVGTQSTVVFGPEGSLDDAPIEKKLRELGIPFTPANIVRVREAAETALLEEHTFKARRRFISETEFEDMLRKLFSKK